MYTQILAPDEVDIWYFAASYGDNLVFSGNRIKDNKKLFGYIPIGGNNWILNDDEGVDEIQVLFR